MRTCPYCNRPVSEGDQARDTCSQCGMPLGRDPLVDLSPSPPGAATPPAEAANELQNARTVDAGDDSSPPPSEDPRVTVAEKRLAQTVSSDSVESHRPAGDAHPRTTIDMRGGEPTVGSIDERLLPSAERLDRTVETGRLEQTVDAEAGWPRLPEAPPDTDDRARIAQTLGSIDLPPPGPLDDLQRTVDASRGMPTWVSDAAGSLPAPFPPRPEEGTSVERTVDSIDLPGPSGTSGQRETVELPAQEETAGPRLPEHADGSSPSPAHHRTVPDLGSVPTVEFSDLFASPPRATDSGPVDARIDQTLDSVDVPRPPADGRGTVHDQRLDATIDSVPGEPAAGISDDQRLTQTLDSLAHPTASPPPGKATVPIPTGHPTLTEQEAARGADVPARPGTIDDRLNATLDSVEAPPAERAGARGAGTLPDRKIDATYDSTDLSSRDAKEVDQMWRGANVEKASPRMTIKGRDERPQDTKTSLVIQRRHFREVKPTDPIEGSTADYDLLKMLGQGGMGVVYAARQASIDRTVAVKMLKPEMSRDVGQRSKFLAEAVITGDLDHPNIVPIYDLGKNPQGALFYAMKKVQGTPWDKVIAHKSLSENLDILQKVADAVAFAHNRNVVHRDLKPENIMLGDFGEVLVMDWGLALPYGSFEKSRSIQASASMGGTPAYMAPEMATGPFDRIAPTSDIYLLGAILYEIVTGKPPHTGRDVMKCLFAAAKNEIQPTDKSGELVDIALKAMSTKQSDRYQTVQEFQAAIREYEAHSSSIAMVVRAEEALEEARKTGLYDTYARAVFEFQEALTLWPGNRKAEKGVSRSKLAYAACALEKGDLDLAESLLDVRDPDHREVLASVAEAKAEREARQQRLQANRRLIRGLVTACLLILATGLAAVSYQTIEVRRQRDLAQENELKAVERKKEADEQRDLAQQSEKEANRQRLIADQNAVAALTEKRNAEQQRNNALKAKEQEERQRLIAEENEAKAIAARKIASEERDKANYEAYVALIGLAAAKIDENAFGYARELLNQCRPELRNWEWGRLMYLCQQSVRDIDAATPVDAVAFSARGDRLVTGGWNGLAQVFRTSDGQRISTLKHTAQHVYAVAYSPTRPEVATGSSNPRQNVQIWNAETGQPIRTFTGHTDGVLSVAYSRDGRRLLTSSFDNTARLWDAETGELLRTFEGHTWWVWSAGFSPDERRIVTASQDGTALVWSVDGKQRSAPFMGHQGPVYAAAFSPDGERVVTGGYDKRVLVWKPGEVAPFDYASLLHGSQTALSRFQALEGHLGAVRSVAFSRDGKLIVSGGHDNAVKVWNAQSGNLVKTLRGHDKWVRACAVSPDGRWALSGGHDNSARLWDIEGYEEARVLQGRWLRGHEDAVMAVAFSPRGDQIVTASRDRTARTWDLRTGRPAQSFDEGHFFLASSAAFIPGGKRLATSAGDNTTRIWDLASGIQLHQLDGTGRASALAVSSDGRWLATGGTARTEGRWVAQLWDAATGERKLLLDDHSGQVTAVTFSPDDRFLFTGDSNGRGVVWRTDTGARVGRLAWHTSKIAAARFLADGTRLITASDDKTVAQWDVRQLARGTLPAAPVPQLTLKHEESVLSLDIAPLQKLALTSTTSGAVRIWDLDRAVILRSLPVGKTDVNAVAFSPDGRRALTAHPGDNCVRVWDVTSGREVPGPGPASSRNPTPAFLDLQALGGAVWSAQFGPGGDKILTVGGNQAKFWDMRAESADHRELMSFSPHAAVVSVAYSPDGRQLVTGSWDNSARIWNVDTGKDERKLVGGHTGTLNSCTYSPDGRYVLTTSDDKTAKLWDVASGKVTRAFTGHTAAVRFGLFSPQGDYVLTASDDKTARLWKTETGDSVRELKSHEWGVLCAAFSADGQRVITGSDDSSARIWDVASGQVLVTLTGHTAAVTSVAFAPDGNRALTASADFTAKLWDSHSGKEILNLKGHTQELTAVAFSKDGRYALTGSQDGTAILWLTTEWNRAAAERLSQQARAGRRAQGGL